MSSITSLAGDFLKNPFSKTNETIKDSKEKNEDFKNAEMEKATQVAVEALGIGTLIEGGFLHDEHDENHEREEKVNDSILEAESKDSETKENSIKNYDVDSDYDSHNENYDGGNLNKTETNNDKEQEANLNKLAGVSEGVGGKIYEQTEEQKNKSVFNDQGTLSNKNDVKARDYSNDTNSQTKSQGSASVFNTNLDSKNGTQTINDSKQSPMSSQREATKEEPKKEAKYSDYTAKRAEENKTAWKPEVKSQDLNKMKEQEEKNSWKDK